MLSLGPMTLEDPKPAMSVETFHVVWFIAAAQPYWASTCLSTDRQEGKKAE